MEDTPQNYVQEMAYDAPFTETLRNTLVKGHWHNTKVNSGPLLVVGKVIIEFDYLIKMGTTGSQNNKGKVQCLTARSQVD